MSIAEDQNRARLCAQQQGALSGLAGLGVQQAVIYSNCARSGLGFSEVGLGWSRYSTLNEMRIEVEDYLKDWDK